MANRFDVEVVNPLQALLIGDQAYQSGIESNRKRAVETARNEAGQLYAAGDTKGALQRLLMGGDLQGAGTYSGLDQQSYQRGRDTTLDTRHDKEYAADYALRKAASDRASDRTPSGFEPNPAGGYRPIAGGPADLDYVERKAKAEKVIDPNLLFDDDTIKAMAQQARAGDTSVFTNIGRGAQGPENLARLRKEITRQNNDKGISGEEQALRNAEMFGVKAGQRSIGTKGANIEMAATEFNQVIPVVQAASKAVSRTSYPDLNKVILAYNEKTGDPNVVRFGGGVNTLINLYARAISPTGTPTVSDKDHAREILNKAWSGGQFDAAVGMMQQEIEAALRSPEKVRDEMRKRFLSGQGAAPVGFPAPSHTPAAPVANDPLGIR